MKRITLLTLLLLMFAGLPVPAALADMPLEGNDAKAEIRFLEGMIDHHQMAVMMAQDCLEKAQTQELLTLCQNILETQSTEIQMMQTWLQDWYGIAYTPDTSGHNGTMNQLARLEGTEYEIAWMEAMIKHHEGAIRESEQILRYEVHPETAQLAEQIIETQSAEIEYMEQLIAELSEED